MKAISIFCSTFFKGIFFIKLKLLSFFNARYPTVSLRGPVLNLKARAKPEFNSLFTLLKRLGIMHTDKYKEGSVFPGMKMLLRFLLLFRLQSDFLIFLVFRIEILGSIVLVKNLAVGLTNIKCL